MSFKEVKELRTCGKIDEALIMAQADLEADSSNVWNKRSISWVYYEFAKNNSELADEPVLELSIPTNKEPFKSPVKIPLEFTYNDPLIPTPP